MKRKKLSKVISGLLSLNMILAYGGIFPFADAGIVSESVVSAESENYSLSADGKTLTISGVASVTQADVIDNITATVRNVVISNGVESISSRAFYGWSKIESVSIANTVSSIGTEAFSGCSRLTSISVPDSVETIAAKTFFGCSGLENVILGNGVKEISGSAFTSCSSLVNIEFPVSVEKISSYAFQGCENLKMVVFKGTVQNINIGDSAFTALQSGGIVKQGNSRLLSENSDHESAVAMLKAAGIPDAWFERYVPAADLFDVSLPTGNDLIYNGNPKTATVTAADGVTGYGTLTVSYKNAAGSAVTLPKEIGEYKVFVSVSGGDVYKATTDAIEVGSFTIVDAVYNVTAAACTNGSVTVDKAEAGKREPVTVTVNPADGYFVTSVFYNNGTTDTPIDLGENGKYSFEMPESNVTVKATFEKPVKTSANPPSCTENGTKEYWTLAGVKYQDSACTVKVENFDTWVVVSKTGHNYGTWNTTSPATCTEDGSQERTCSACSNVDSVVISALGHNYDSGTVTKEATETATGIMTYKCTNAGCTATRTESIPKKTHVHSWNTVYTTDREPTCTEAGSKSIHCSSCDAKKEGSETPVAVIAHTPGELKVTAATCTANGSKVQKCTVCGEFLVNETITSEGHKWKTEATVDTPATCTEAGSKSVHCSVCNAVKTGSSAVINATGHTPGEWVEKQAATCETAGLKIRNCASCGGPVDTQDIPATGHSYGEWVVTLEPTETEAGSKTKTCSACNDTVTETIEPLGHTHHLGDWEVVTAATCTTNGLEVKKCTSCKETVEERAILAAGHTEGEWTVKVSATCETAGTEVKKCTKCNSELDEKSVPAAGHKYGEWVVTNPTETEAGSKTKTCSVCNDTVTETISALGHTHKTGDWEVAAAATCTTDGLEVKKCTACGEELEEKVIKASGHAFGEWTVKTAATCTEDGTEVRICGNCGETETKTIKAAGHKWNLSATVDKAPTCTEEGCKSIHCSVCNAKQDPIKIEVTEHNWNTSATVDVEPTCTEEGHQSVHCTGCTAVKDGELIPATDHCYGEWVTTKEATLRQNGSAEKVCEACGDTITKTTESGIETAKRVVKFIINKLKKYDIKSYL